MSKFEDKVSELEKQISNLTEKLENTPVSPVTPSSTSNLKENICSTLKHCSLKLYSIVAVIPVVLFMFLYFVKPRFVKSKVGSKYVRSNKKVFSWTIFLSIILWGFVYGYNKYNSLGYICF